MSISTSENKEGIKKITSPEIKHPNRTISSHWGKHISSTTSTAECNIINLHKYYARLIPWLTPKLNMSATCINKADKVNLWWLSGTLYCRRKADVSTLNCFIGTAIGLFLKALLTHPAHEMVKWMNKVRFYFRSIV